MRTAHKVWGGIAAGVFGLVAVGDLTGSSTPAPVATTASAPVAAPVVPAAAPAPVAAPVAAPAAPARPAAPAPRSVIVSDVLDGDTFVAGGQKVRVLGIDSCDAGTYGGRLARSTAEGLLEGQRVTLRTEPGVDRDSSGRLLRYVDTTSGDYAESMVVFDHTGVLAGRADADYVAKLRDADPNGRRCAAPAPVATSSSDDDTVTTGGGSIDWPTPGDQGLPDGALTGGYCKKKWWC